MNLHVITGSIQSAWCDVHMRTEPVVAVYSLSDDLGISRLGTYWVDHNDDAAT